jgi:hypothetical protein
MRTAQMVLGEGPNGSSGVAMMIGKGVGLEERSASGKELDLRNGR